LSAPEIFVVETELMPPQKTPGIPVEKFSSDGGDSIYLSQLVDEVLTWPHIESAPSFVSRPETIRIRLIDKATINDLS
jgi:hypothetical protein